MLSVRASMICDIDHILVSVGPTVMCDYQIDWNESQSMLPYFCWMKTILLPLWQALFWDQNCNKSPTAEDQEVDSQEGFEQIAKVVDAGNELTRWPVWWWLVLQIIVRQQKFQKSGGLSLLQSCWLLTVQQWQPVMQEFWLLPVQSGLVAPMVVVERGKEQMGAWDDHFFVTVHDR